MSKTSAKQIGLKTESQNGSVKSKSQNATPLTAPNVQKCWAVPAAHANTYRQRSARELNRQHDRSGSGRTTDADRTRNT